METLETRDVPSADVCTWLGGLGTGSDPNAFGDAANWAIPGKIGETPTSDDSIVIAPRWVSSGGLMMDPPVLTSFNCDGMSGTFAVLTIDPDYTGTITLSGALEVDGFDMQNGTIDQPTSGTDITVNYLFMWTNGTIDSTSNVATVSILDSTTAAIEPDGGTLYLGSNLSIEDGTILTMGAGTIVATNDDMLISIDADSGVVADPGESNELEVKASPGVVGANIDIKTGSFLEVRSGKFIYPGQAFNEGGRFTLFAGTTAEFTGGTTWSYGQNSGTTQLTGGSKLTSPKNIVINGGTLTTISTNGSSSDATIQTPNLKVFGGDIYIGDTVTPHTYGTLSVLGDVLWVGGTYHPAVRDMNNGDHDEWRATGTFTVGFVGLGPPILAPRALDADGRSVVPTTGRTWQILQGFQAIVEDVAASYDGDSWAIDPSGNPVKYWVLRAK